MLLDVTNVCHFNDFTVSLGLGPGVLRVFSTLNVPRHILSTTKVVVSFLDVRIHGKVAANGFMATLASSRIPRRETVTVDSHHRYYTQLLIFAEWRSRQHQF